MCGCSSRTRRTRPSASASCFRIARSSSCATTTRRRTTSSRRRCKHGPTSRSCIAARRSSSTASVSRPSGGCSSSSSCSGKQRASALRHSTEQRAAEPPAEFDLIVGADGVNSTVRGWQDFGTTLSHLTNKFAWYGASTARYAHADVRREPARRVQCPPLPALAR